MGKVKSIKVEMLIGYETYKIEYVNQDKIKALMQSQESVSDFLLDVINKSKKH